MKNRKIKYSIEEIMDYPATYNDDNISNEMKKIMKHIFISNLIWCHDNEELFNNPCMCDTFVETPIKKGYIRIKYAREHTIYVPYNEPEKYIEHRIKYLAEYQNARSFIWCYEDEELFKED